MATVTHIEWTEQTWNPTTGCTKVSPGCKNCYAETLAKRLRAMKTPGYENGFDLSLLPERLDQPRHRKTPTMYFVNSMSDLFHDRIPFAFIDQVLDTITDTPRHTYQILTKRPGIMAKYFRSRPVPANAWLGVSVENQKYGLPRIDVLRKIDAAVRFLSIEPLLEDLGTFDLTDIEWVIVGGESGKKARPMSEVWVDRIHAQCQVAGVPFFFKQWGAWSKEGERHAKRENGREFRGRTWDEMPTVSSSRTLAQSA